MFNYTCLNPIAGVGLDLFSDDYKKVDDIKDADAALVRSAAMHDMELGDKVLAVARAGAGVNNIPLDKCAEQGNCCIQHTGSQCKWRQRAGACRHAACIPAISQAVLSG